MSFIIEDGGGSGTKAKVGDGGRLKTRAITEPEEAHANEEGNAYNINTKNITLTNDTDTPILYIKNNEETNLVIAALAFGVKSSTGGSSTDLPEVTIIRNPTAGTIIDNATNADINSNRNYGDTGTLADSLVYKGATGNTMTDGADHLFIYLNQLGRSFITINEVLPKGTSLGVKVKCQASNTSQTLYCAAICYLHTEDF